MGAVPVKRCVQPPKGQYSAVNILEGGGSQAGRAPYGGPSGTAGGVKECPAIHSSPAGGGSAPAPG